MDVRTCSGCGKDIAADEIDCDMYSQFWCLDCGGVSQCGECGHMMATQEMNFDGEDEGTCENCNEEEQ